ncbi:MAG: 2-dehydropantoate 2-reductase [Candidatus Heimdallarchaeota archaeon LC_3]|nr:MAG: 2-dehydropantoate 2-reductase [Candidatus Heimdallarchaeota archaeon LC_3]
MVQSVLIYGAGSIGSLFAGRLCKSGVSISLVGREPHVSVCNTSGITIHNLEKKKSQNSCPTSAAPTISELQQDIDLNPDIIIVSCKAYDNEYTAMDLKSLVNKNKSIKIVLLQNGVGNEEVFYEYYDPEIIYRIITSEGALLTSPGNVLHGGQGKSFIGHPLKNVKDNLMKEVASLLTDVGIQTTATDQINKEIWTKCLINSPINPIATLNNVRNGELLKQPSLKNLVIKVVEEIINVFKIRNITISNNDPLDTVFSVVKNTSENKCSMLQDIERGRQTEIDFLNGRIVREASLGKIDAPFNFNLYNQVKQLEIRPSFSK